MARDGSKPELQVRPAKIKDISEIITLSSKVYGKQDEYTSSELRGQISHFPEGQFVAVYKDKIVGYCSSIIVKEKQALSKHTWNGITGNGYGTTHNPKGDYLYGIDVFVDATLRRMRIGQRFYQERKNLCKYLRLKGIVFAGRMPLLRKKIKQVGTPEKYLEEVQENKIRDPVFNFQIREGFEVLGILKNYNPTDKESLGHALHMVWYNPEASAQEALDSKSKLHRDNLIRVAAVQYMQREIRSFKEFENIITYFVDVVSEYQSDFVLFPEMMTLQILSIENAKLSPEKAILKLTEYTKPFKKLFSHLAVKYNVNIIAGSHPVQVEEDKVNNISYIFLRDGSIYEQPKIHPTPDEKYWWNITGGNALTPIETDCGTIGVLICYDAEFPELARHLVDQGANILFVPFCTDERQGYLRVRYCAHARAVENQCYVVMAGNVGNLPRVSNMDIQYGQSCVLTPCDFEFARDGIAADSTPNVETVIFADLRLDSLYESRSSGTVVTFSGRRHDLFKVVWHKKH
ncbi:MAG: bifunctional GNAT family N-acetyltransferase/carbon-nitrogen hydrolase family protein [Chlamydiales bacterium]